MKDIVLNFHGDCSCMFKGEHSFFQRTFGIFAITILHSCTATYPRLARPRGRSRTRRHLLKRPANEALHWVRHSRPSRDWSHRGRALVGTDFLSIYSFRKHHCEKKNFLWVRRARSRSRSCSTTGISAASTMLTRMRRCTAASSATPGFVWFLTKKQVQRGIKRRIWKWIKRDQAAILEIDESKSVRFHSWPPPGFLFFLGKSRIRIELRDRRAVGS